MEFFPMLYVGGERWKNAKNGKRRQKKYKHINVLIHNTLGQPLGLYKLPQMGTGKSLT